MYNEELKSKFILGYTKSQHTANVAVVVFNAAEKYEVDWGADLCTRGSEDLQHMIDEIVGLRLRSQWMSLGILKEYVRWCISMRVPGACDGMLSITAAGLNKVRTQMVASPLHLQMYLDDVFDKESEETIDNLYRCYFWMSYGGIPEEDTISIKCEDVDLLNMRISYNGTTVPIYREAIPAFKNAISLNSFLYKHPNYKNDIRRDRIPGDTIMRGIKANTKIMTIRSTLSKKVKSAIDSGATEQQLSFHRVWMSGLFYRIYDRERAGLPVDFSEAAADFMEGRTYSNNGVNHRVTLAHKQNRIAASYMEDYQRWKLAFSI